MASPFNARGRGGYRGDVRGHGRAFDHQRGHGRAFDHQRGQGRGRGRDRSDEHVDKLSQKTFIRFLIPPPSVPSDEILASTKDKDTGEELKAELGDWKAQLKEVADKVLAAKKLLEADDIKETVETTLHIVDLYAGLKYRMTKSFNGQNVTNAWIKIYEIIAQMGIIPLHSEGAIRAFFNAELPGAFTVATNHFVRTLCPSATYEWVASSYYPLGAGTSSEPSTKASDATILGDKYGLFHCNRDRWLMDPPSEIADTSATETTNSSPKDTTGELAAASEGKSDTKIETKGTSPSRSPEVGPHINNGDITDPANIVGLVRRAADRFEGDAVTLYTSDAGIDVSADYGRQEELTSLINMGQIVLALLALGEGGDMVTKQYTYSNPFSATFLALVAGFFRELYVTKPMTSRPANSEIYVVGKGFLGISQAAARALLDHITRCKAAGKLPTDLPPISEAPELAAPLEALIRATRQIHMRQQVDFLAEASRFARKYRPEVLRKALSRLATQCQDTWLSNNGPVRRIEPSAHIPFLTAGRCGTGPVGGQLEDEERAPKEGGKESKVLDLTCPPHFLDELDELCAPASGAMWAAIDTAARARSPLLPLWYQPDLKNAPELKYESDRGKFRSALHAGQRKLCVGEIRALATVLKGWDEKATVVYPGAAPGIHIPFLSSLFPNVAFHLYDPAKFAIRDDARITTHQAMFTDDVAREWEKKGCDFFISDIRLSVPGRERFEKQVGVDMAAQARWLDIIRPRLGGMLKFRPPYGKGEFEYLDGRVMLQAWAPQRSTESRLLVPGAPRGEALPVRRYDHGRYEDFMYWLNAVQRDWAFYPGVPRALGADHCYDCAHEAAAWRQYLEFRRGPDAATPTQVAGMMDALSAHTPKPLCAPGAPHGHSPDTPMCQKRGALCERFKATINSADPDDE